MNPQKYWMKIQTKKSKPNTMKTSNKHEITIRLDCELFARIQEATKFVGCGEDLEKYIINIITEKI